MLRNLVLQLSILHCAYYSTRINHNTWRNDLGEDPYSYAFLVISFILFWRLRIKKLSQDFCKTFIKSTKGRWNQMFQNNLGHFSWSCHEMKQHKQKIRQFNNFSPEFTCVLWSECCPVRTIGVNERMPPPLQKLKAILIITFVTLFYYIQLVSVFNNPWQSVQWV